MPASYTLKKLTEVEDSAAGAGFGDVQEARFARGDLEAEDTGVSLHRFNANKRQSFGHKHENAEEVYVVMRGSGRAKLDNDIVEVEALDAIRVAPGVVRAFEGGPDGLDVLAFGPHHPSDGELIHDWWVD
jgi:mannose-6-phosphate isomerase-like protein (cupin superfamily)